MFFDIKNQVGACFITNGGYYEHQTHPGIIDIFYNTLDLIIANYWPQDEAKTEFTFFPW